MQGDKLARGAKSATFAPMGASKTQKEWDAMWEPEKKFEAGAVIAPLPPEVEKTN